MAYLRFALCYLTNSQYAKTSKITQLSLKSMLPNIHFYVSARFPCFVLRGFHNSDTVLLYEECGNAICWYGLIQYSPHIMFQLLPTLGRILLTD